MKYYYGYQRIRKKTRVSIRYNTVAPLFRTWISIQWWNGWKKLFVVKLIFDKQRVKHFTI